MLLMMMMIDDVTVSGAADSATSRVRWSCSDVIISVKTRSHSTATKNLKITHYSMNVHDAHSNTEINTNISFHIKVYGPNPNAKPSSVKVVKT